MTKNYLILAFCLISVITYAQKFETNVTISPLITNTALDLIDSHDYGFQSEVAFGFSGAIQEFYNVSQKIAIGTELQYSNCNYTIYPVFYYGDYGYGYKRSPECKLDIETFNVPLYLRFQTAKKWIYMAGFGVTYVINSNIDVYSYYRQYTYNIREYKKRLDENFNIEGDFNSYYSFSFGKGFNIKQKAAMIQLYFEQTVNEYLFRYKHGDYYDDLKFRPLNFGLRLGISL
jgi:hypothetical protein